MPPLISLVPNSGIHFWDVDLDADALPRQARTFWEEPLGGPADENGAARVKLHELVPDPETRQMVEALSRDAPPAEETYPISARNAFDLHLGRWAPLPYFLLLARTVTGQESYGRGPSNWARGRLVAHPNPAPGRTHRLTLAFDTALLKGGMRPEDVARVQAEIIDDGALPGALGWYRALPFAPRDVSRTPVTVPTTYVWSDRDVALSREAAEACGRFVEGDYRYVELEGVSHWVPRQAADLLAAEIVARVRSGG